MESSRVSIPVQDKTAVSGEPITLICIVSGKPAPEVYWTKQQSRFEANDGSNLKIEKTTISDSGNYTCHAVNAAGEDSRTVNVDIWSPAMITTQGKFFKNRFPLSFLKVIRSITEKFKY